MTVVAEILNAMSGITKPHRKFVLTLFAAMLVTGRRLNLSRHSAVHEQTYRRHVQQPFDFASFNQLAIAKAMPAASTQIFAQDASFSRKSGRHTYGLDTFWNGCASKAERGLEVSLMSIVDVEANQSFAVSAEQTPPQSTIKKHEKAATRIDFYLEHLARTTAYFPATIKFQQQSNTQCLMAFTPSASSLLVSLRWAIRSSANCAQTPTCAICTKACNAGADAAASSTAKSSSPTWSVWQRSQPTHQPARSTRMWSGQ